MKFGQPRINKNYRKNSLLVRVILSYLLVGVVSLSALSFFMYDNFSRNGMAEIKNIAQNMTLQYYNVSEKLFSSIYSYFYTLYYTNYRHTSDFTVFNALYLDNLDEFEKANIRKKLTAEAAANPWIHSIYIYNARAGLVFSNIGSAAAVDDFYDSSIIPVIKGLKQRLNPVFIPRKFQYTLYGQVYKCDALTILYAEFLPDETPDAAMVVNIDLQKLQNVFITENNKAELFIIDRDGIIVSHTDSALVNTDISDEDHIRRILTDTAGTGNFQIKINGRDSFVTYVRTGRATGWSYVRVDDMNELMRNMHNVQRNVLLLTFLFGLTGILIAAYFTVGVYVPLDQRIKKLSASVKNFEPIKKNYLLKRMLDGQINSHDFFEDNPLVIDFYAPGFMIIILGFDSFHTLNGKLTAETISLYRHSVIDVSLEILKNMTDIISHIETHENDDHVCFILSLKNPNDESVQKIKTASADIINRINKNFGFKITAALGKTTDNINGIHDEYINALSYLNYKIVLGNGGVITNADIEKLRFVPYEYPVKKEKQLIEALMLCDKPDAVAVFDEFITVVRNFTYDEIMLSFIQLALASIRAMETVINIQDVTPDLEYTNIFRSLARFDSMNNIREWFLAMYSRVIDILIAKKDTRKDAVVAKLEDYIVENYSNPNLSIDLLADIVDLSANYIRIIYKDKTSRSLSNYISEIRLTKAKELLLTTNTPINKIPEMVGFQSSGYFYRNFRKYAGKTPDQFRKEIKQNGAD